MAKTTEDKKKREAAKPREFGIGLDPERNIGATDLSGELVYLIKRKGRDEADLVHPVKLTSKAHKLLSNSTKNV